MIRYSLFVLLFLASSSLVRAEEDDWTGQWVLPRTSREIVQLSDDKGSLTWSVSAGKVIRVEKDSLVIRHSQGIGPYEGKVLKSQVVKLANAVKYFTALVEENGQDTWGLSRRAEAWTLKGEHKKAIEDLTEVIRLDPSAESYLTRGLAQYAKEDYDKAIKDYDEAISLDPTSEFAFYDRSLCWYANAEYTKAIADCSEAIKLDPKFAAAYSKRANAWARKKEYDKAIADYSEAISLDPKFAPAYCNRANSWTCKKEYDKAIKDCDEAIKLDPTLSDAFSHRGDARYAQKEYDKAITDYTEAISLDPKSASALTARADVWSAKKEYAKALEDLNTVLPLDLENADSWNSLAWFLATCPEAKYRDGSRAVELARKSCELSNWKDVLAIDTLAAAYAEIGEFGKAIEFQKKSIEGMTKAEDKELGEKSRARLKLYEQKKPYRDEIE
jgi:tetratricopeptide (TPR) repeat protein